MAAGKIPQSSERYTLENRPRRGYNSWRQVAGYFDGDGAVYVSIKKYVLKIRLCFYDAWKPQLEGIKAFLETRGIRTRQLAVQRKKLGDVWYLTISDAINIRVIARKILPFLCKKRGDLLIALGYLDGKLTAEEAIAELNESVNDKRRSGYIRKATIPYTRSEGTILGRRQGAEAGASAVRVAVPLSLQERIRKDRMKRGSTLSELQLKYGYSIHVVRRILEKSRASREHRKPIC